MTANFLWNSGTSNNGLLVTALALETSELNTLTNGSTALSSVGGSSGAFNQSNTAQAMWADLFLTLGAIGSALAAGANIAGWFVLSYDGGTTFEATATALSRPPDFLIPLPASTISAASVAKASGKVLMPALPFKVLTQNNTGQSLASSANTLRGAFEAIQY